MRPIDYYTELRITQYTVDFSEFRDDQDADHTPYQVTVNDVTGIGDTSTETWYVTGPDGVFNWMTGGLRPR